MKTLPRGGLLLVIAVGLVWGVNWPVLKVALNEMPPWTFRALIVAPGGLLLLLAARLAGHALTPPRGQWRPFLLVSFLHITVWYGLSAMALKFLASTEAVLIAFTMPLWAALFGVWLLGERLSVRRIFALTLGMGGMVALLGGNLGALGVSPKGAAIMATGAFVWGLATVLLKRTAWQQPVITLTGWQLVVGGVPLALGGLIFEGFPLEGYSEAAWWAVAYNVVLSIAFGTWGWFKIVSLLPASVSALSALLIPVVGVATGNLWLGEPVGIREISALVLVLAALGLTLINPARRQNPAARNTG